MGTILTREQINNILIVDYCPNLTRKLLEEQIRKVIKWGDGICPHSRSENTHCLKHSCNLCWTEFKEEYINIVH